MDGGVTLISHGTIIDLDHLGHSEDDIEDGCVLVEGENIIWSGPCKLMPKEIPLTKEINASGKYILPGLMDGFAAINKQAYCNAYLYNGVTSIVSVDGGRRGVFFGNGHPSPVIYRLEGVGLHPIATDTLLSNLRRYAKKGYKVMLLMYGLTPEQISIAIRECHKLGMVTIGELGQTTYAEGLQLGLDAIVHTTRYSLDVAPKAMADAVAKEPFSNDLQSPKWKYYHYLMDLQRQDSLLIDFARKLGASKTFIMPTSSLSYLDLPEHKNPWKMPGAKILSPKDVNRPADPKTGNHTIPAEEQKAYSRLIASELNVIEPTYYAHGAKYLAGSGTDVWGTMPGISLHTELELLHHKVGLTKREALAAATTNFFEAYGWNIGKIAAGFKANILVLNKNPLEDLLHLHSIEVLMLKGEIIDREELLKRN